MKVQKQFSPITIEIETKEELMLFQLMASATLDWYSKGARFSRLNSFVSRQNSEMTDEERAVANFLGQIQ